MMWKNFCRLIATGLVLSITVSAAAHEPEDPVVFGECSCEPPMYTLITTAAINGEISKTPDEEVYPKGAWVHLTFTPDEGYMFNGWSVAPSSKMAFMEISPSILVQITGHTTVAASAVVDHTELTVVPWGVGPGGMSIGTVNGHSSGFTTTIGAGETLTLTAAPASGYQVLRWGGVSSDSDSSGFHYRNAVTIKGQAGTTVNPSIRTLGPSFTEIPQNPPDMHTFSISLQGGVGEVFTAESPSGHTAGSYAHASAEGVNNEFAYSIQTDTFHSLVALLWYADGAYRYTTNGAATNMRGTHGGNPLSYTAELTPTARLVILTEGEGVVTGNNIKKGYHPRQLHPQGYAGFPGADAANAAELTNSNLVTLTPSACEGWKFSHWEYNTGAGLDSTTNTNLSFYMNWWQGSGIRLQSDNQVMKVTAVFEEICTCYYNDKCLDYLGMSLEGEQKVVPICKTDEATPIPPGPNDKVYNCIAWSVGISDKWIEEIWPNPAPPPPWFLAIDYHFGDQNGSASMSEWDYFYQTHGYTRTTNTAGARVGLIPGAGLHAYKIDGCGGNWESKLGQNIRITHGDTWLVNIVSYGEPVYYYE